MQVIQLSRCRWEEKSPHISVNKRGQKATPLGYLFSGGKVLPYIRTFTPPKVKALFKIPFTYSEVRRGKSQPWVRENFYPLTNSEFQPPICKPWEVKFPIFNCLKKNPSIYPDIWGGQSQPKSKSFWKTSSLIPTFEGRFVNPEAITFLLSSYISGHLGPRNHSLCRYYFCGDACGHHLRGVRITT